MNAHFETHTDINRDILSYRVNDDELNVFFGNKKSSFFPTLEFPISKHLHKFIKSTSIYDREIHGVLNKLKNLSIEASFDVPKSGDGNDTVYFKIEKSYFNTS